MQTQYKHTVNGQGVYEQDINVMGEAAALADDRVLAELFKLGHSQKGIIPTGIGDANIGGGCVVHANTGGVLIKPFRAMLGPTESEAADALESWQGVRSAVCVGTNTQYFDVTLDDNSSGSPRWDLIYAILTPDLASASEDRKVKSPSTGAITTESIAPYLVSTVSVTKVAGTASFDHPEPPTPTSGSYHIPLAYVRVPNGFNGSTILDRADIWDVAPTLELNDCTGSMTVKPASCQFTPRSGPYVGRQAYGGADNQRPPTYMPPSMTGGETRLVAIDLTTVDSHVAGDIVDDSIDWSDRLFKWTAFAHASTDTPAFAWEQPISPSEDHPIPSAVNGTSGSSMAAGLGQTCFADVTSKRVALHLNNTKLSALGSGNEITFYVVPGETALRIGITGTPAVKLFVWLESTGQFTNR